MKMKKQNLATLGLIFITFLAAIQYVFLQNVPEDISSFAFVCITNAIGVGLLGAVRFKSITHISGKTLKKGIFFAVELIGFNIFALLGSRHLDAVIIASVISLYFVFITPILLILKKKINFFSAVATAIAIIALILMFGADTETLFSSPDVIYLIIADIFFAAYVVSVSVLGEGEDSTQLTFTQMLFSAIFTFVGWAIQGFARGDGLRLPVDGRFWVSAIFIGIFIRVIYGLVQISCQQYVSALKASLIFAAEVLITLLTNPIMCRLFDMDYTPMTVFQLIGGILFVIATLMVDDNIMVRFGYEDLQDVKVDTGGGEMRERSSVTKKIISITLYFSLIALILSTLICLSSIFFIRNNAVENSMALGENASEKSSVALQEQLEVNISNQVTDKTLLTEEKLEAYSDAVLMAADYAHTLYVNAGQYPDREVARPLASNGGIWAMQRTIAAESVDYADVREENKLLGNMINIFRPIIENNDNIATIYLSTETGLMVSYDPNSDTAAVEEGESYYEYRNSDWYLEAKSASTYFFSDPYQDGYGRGLTISCVAPIKGANGEYAGCVAMDILIRELNESMVGDGIEEPSTAALIDGEGKYIARSGVDESAASLGTIFDADQNAFIREAGDRLLKNHSGVVKAGEGEDAVYIAYSTIDSTGWTLCIVSPVSVVTQPAREIRASIDESTDNVVAIVVKGISNVIQSIFVLIACVLLFVTLFVGKRSKRISDPLKKLESDVREISSGNLDKRTDVETDDEIGTLAASFNYMTESLQKYIVDLKDATAREERIASELSLATKIQADMLPNIFPAFPERTDFDVYASMDPAKEVGGDFYDFFMIDADHMGLVIADVSGKGVPAALFMMMAKILIANYGMIYSSPAEVMDAVNKAVCKNNEEDMFVTVWFGILTLSTGHVVAANAGHEYPMIRKPGGQFELLKDEHDFVVGGFDFTEYNQYEFDIERGGTLFVYTDGLPEATNIKEEMYGTDRALEVLNRDPGATPEELIHRMKAAVDEFVGEADPFDDLTMMAFHLK